jgi:hypothetical protein
MACATCGDPTGKCYDLNSDVQHCGTCQHVCQQGEKCVAGSCAGGDSSQFIISTAGFAAADFGDPAIDLNGDGTPDNQFINVINAIRSYGDDLQMQVELMIWGGELVILLDMPSRVNRNRPALVYMGIPPNTPPSWGPNDVYSVDLSQGACPFYGQRTDTDFSATATPGPAPPLLNLIIRSTLAPGLKFSIPLHVHYVRMNFVPLSTNTTYMDVVPGFLNGSIKLVDLNNSLIAVSKYLNADISAPVQPGTQAAFIQSTLKQLFDTGGGNDFCINPDGTKSLAGDGKIGPCEILSLPKIKASLVPDLQVYNANGSYVPNQPPVKPDSLSFALWYAGNPCKILQTQGGTTQ